MVRYNEKLLLLREKKILKIKSKYIIFGSSGRVRVRVRFDPKIYGFFGFGLFRVRVEKIVFRTQNFRTGSGRVFGSGQFLTGLLLRIIYISVNCIMLLAYANSEVSPLNFAYILAACVKICLGVHKTHLNYSSK